MGSRPSSLVPRRTGHYSIVSAAPVVSYAAVNETPEARAKAKRATIVLYAVMAVGILLPFAILWLKR